MNLLIKFDSLHGLRRVPVAVVIQSDHELIGMGCRRLQQYVNSLKMNCDRPGEDEPYSSHPIVRSHR